jgi:hypothetical protein
MMSEILTVVKKSILVFLVITPCGVDSNISDERTQHRITH